MNNRFIIQVFIFSFILGCACKEKVNAQNLVVNGDFEELWYPDPYWWDFDVAKYWYKGNLATADLWTPIWFVDYNMFSTISGGNYVGAHTLGRCVKPDGTEGIISWYEYPQGPLSQPLKKDSIYLVSFIARLSESLGFLSTDQYGIRFIDSMEVIQDYGPKLNRKALLTYEVLPFDEQWHSYSWYYKAHGGEKYVELGGYPTESRTHVNAIDVGICCYNNNGNVLTSYGDSLVYMAFDDVKVIPVPRFKPPNVVTVNGDGINDAFSFTNTINCQLNIVNRWGESVFDSKKDTVFPTHQMLDKPLSEGVYFWKLVLDGEVYDTGFIHLIN
jgi:hypothetical protein